jgi:hypothetical protein
MGVRLSVESLRTTTSVVSPTAKTSFLVHEKLSNITPVESHTVPSSETRASLVLW